MESGTEEETQHRKRRTQKVRPAASVGKVGIRRGMFQGTRTPVHCLDGKSTVKFGEFLGFRRLDGKSPAILIAI
ncbi:hypothetical protein HQN88_20550 [Paenibacillus qinlingensis]|nr:hypothetical protein [Paenibacillus qinlingensis]